MKTISFKQVMVIPALTTLGLGSLLYAQHLSLERPVNAAPLSASATSGSAATFQIAQADPVQLAQATPVQLAQAPAGATAQGVEFGGETVQEEVNPNQIRATTRNDLVKQARENSGREDPFVSLLNPNPALIVPLAPAPAPLAELEALPAVPRKPGKGSAGTGISLPAPNVYYDGGVAYEVPNWNVSGILNTGRDAIAILERDGTIREARLNEVLEDGSKVVKIDSSSVVLQKQGRRYAKTIGGTE
ncbi:hypothetical protein D3C87_717840 [compost metagenome]